VKLSLAYGTQYHTDMVVSLKSLWLLAVIACGVATAQTIAAQYEIGQELGFSRQKQGSQEDNESMVTPEVLDRLRREATTGKKGGPKVVQSSYV
jgi:hypothetical protein